MNLELNEKPKFKIDAKHKLVFKRPQKEDTTERPSCVVCDKENQKGKWENFPVCNNCLITGDLFTYVVFMASNFLKTKNYNLSSLDTKKLNGEGLAKLLLEISEQFIEQK